MPARTCLMRPREQLAEASAPPIRPVAMGAGARAFKVGGETVMFRHEKTFYNPTAIGGCDFIGHGCRGLGHETERVECPSV